MKSARILLVPALLLALFSSCKKDDGSHNTVVPGSGFRTLDEAMASTAPKEKSTSFGVASGDTLFGPGGTKFIVPPNVFETLTGQKVTGSVKITMNDWLMRGDMVFGKVLPLNYGKVIQSGGEAFIQVTQNGQILRIRKDTFLTVMFPQFGIGTAGMQPWTGRDMISSANRVNWLPAAPGQLLPTDIADTISVRADTLHYIAVGNLVPTGSVANFRISVNSPKVLEQSMAIALYKGSRSMFPLPSVENGQVNAVQVPQAPMNIAVFGINQGQFFGGIVDVDNPSSDSTYVVKLKATEPPTLRLEMNLLP